MVTKQCPVCGEDFSVKPSEISRGWGIYCSKRCKGISQMKPNGVVEHPDCLEILLQRGMSTFIDREDLEKVRDYHWLAVRSGKTRLVVEATHLAGVRIRKTKLHRIILDAPEGMTVDHISGDTLDIRRSNLRLCNKTENNRNRRKGIRSRTSSKFKGVYLDVFHGKWAARIGSGGKKIHLGYFESEAQAAAAYDEAALRYHGDFARLNAVAA